MTRRDAPGAVARFVRLLQQAYSGELGAAIAYAGHATSVSDPPECERIRQIHDEELDHRARVGRMLAKLGAEPDRLLELRNWCVGNAIARFCHIGGWFLPMYGAGWIERRNIVEYERAARLSVQCAEGRFADELLDLAEVEWEHERYFREKAASHRLASLLPVWSAPDDKAKIRQAFGEFLTDYAAGVATPEAASTVTAAAI